MVTKREILAKINESIFGQNGSAVTLNSTLDDANIDTFGAAIVISIMCAEFGLDEQRNDFNFNDLKGITIRDLVSKCLLHFTNVPIIQDVNVIKLSVLN